MRYVVEGSVRRAAGRVRVAAQLIDATTGSHIWAERYDRELEHVFAVRTKSPKQWLQRLARRGPCRTAPHIAQTARQPQCVGRINVVFGILRRARWPMTSKRWRVSDAPRKSTQALRHPSSVRPWSIQGADCITRYGQWPRQVAGVAGSATGSRHRSERSERWPCWQLHFLALGTYCKYVAGLCRAGVGLQPKLGVGTLDEGILSGEFGSALEGRKEALMSLRLESARPRERNGFKRRHRIAFSLRGLCGDC